MNVFGAIWEWIIAHWANIVGGVTSVKLFAETVDSIKKLAPAKLEGKEATQEYITQTISIVEDKNKVFEEKQFEVDARKELVEDLIKLTAIEAGYNIARYTIFTAGFAFMMHLFARIVMGQKSSR